MSVRGAAGSDIRVWLVSRTASGNGLGRAYALWLVCAHLGWETTVIVPPHERVWDPLADDVAFVGSLRRVDDLAGADAEVVIALKPLPGSLDVAARLARPRGALLVLDVDDPDWEATYGSSPIGIARRCVHLAVDREAWFHPLALRRRAASVRPTLISNPALSRWYGGAVVPHARRPRPAGRPPERGRVLRVAFVGTPWRHKGIDVLRAAAAILPDVELTITAPAPPDARPHEHWIGTTTLAEGLAVVDDADVVALPSLVDIYALGQLPVKLIDAMMAGRTVIASDLPPMRWALGGTGLLVAPGDARELAGALDRARSSDLRTELGARARERALTMFTPDVIGPTLDGVVRAFGRVT